MTERNKTVSMIEGDSTSVYGSAGVARSPLARNT